MVKNKKMLREFAETTAAVFMALCLALLLHQFLPLPNLSLVFLMPVVFAGVRHGMWPSLYAAIIDFCIYNFFFTEPYYTLNVYKPGDLATLVFYLVVAIAVGNLAVRLKTHMEELERMAATLEESRILSETEKLRTALLSSISHDLRTPLASIIGSVTSLQELGDELPSQARDGLLENVHSEAERLNRFIQNLLDMTKLGHGGLKPKADWVEVRDLIGGALRRVEKTIDQRKIKIGIEPSLDTLYVDPVLMEQVIFNLLDNAIKFSSPASQITISFASSDEEARLIIMDEGSGVPEKDRERVFDMFYRVRSGDSQVAGTGLGLSICRGIVEAHGGRIKLEAGASGKGTSAVMIFPASSAGASHKKRDATYG